MKPMPQPVSLVAERAVRYLRKQGNPVSSRVMCREVLATRSPNEKTARRVLEAAFGGDRRLIYDSGLWHLAEQEPVLDDGDRSLLFVRTSRPSRQTPPVLESVSALRLSGDDVVGACGGDTLSGAPSRRLRRALSELLEQSIPVTHASKSEIAALNRWLGQPIPVPVYLRRLASDREGLPASHTLEQLVAHFDLEWRETEDPLDMADTLEACLTRLRRAGERLSELRGDGVHRVTPIDWTRFDFDRQFLDEIPAVPGTYRFLDEDDELVYVGKSKNLKQRIQSYFREDGRPRSERIQRIVEQVHSIEFDPSGSELEALLREAEQITRDDPRANVQRQIRSSSPRSSGTIQARRLDSILILEPAAPPHVLQAFLIRDRRLVGRVPIGVRGGGLRRIEQLLTERFFVSGSTDDEVSGPALPPEPDGPDLDVELIARWLNANRDKAVAFDPTDLGDPGEVIERLRWFLHRGGPFDEDGSPIHDR